MRLTEKNSTTCRRSVGHPRLIAFVAGLLVCLTAVTAERPAAAQEFTFHAEAAAGLWLDEPQSDRFTPGFYFALRPSIQLGRFVALQWSYAMLYTPAGENFTEDGIAHFLMGGVRVFPLASLQPVEDQLGGLFVDFNLGYVRTGDLDRFGFDAGLGYGFQVAPWLSLGPVVRYGQIVQANTPNEDPNDAQFLTVGLDLSFGAAYEEEEELACPDAPECVQEEPKIVEVIVEVEVPAKTDDNMSRCLDEDQDGICDDYDRCPSQKGGVKTYGCPIDPCSGKPLIVHVQFKHDSSKLPVVTEDDPQTMDPVLDAVADAIALDPTCRVCIMGYASLEGSDEYNDQLSRERAEAVQSYMATRSKLTKEKIPTTGLGSRCQIEPKTSLSLNRRVEFRRLGGEGETCPTDCSE